MKKIILTLNLLALLFVFSCSNSNSDNSDNVDSSFNTVVDIDDNSNLNQSSSDVQSIQIKAQFNGLVLGTRGAVMIFKDQNGKEYIFNDDGNQQVHNLFSDVNPTDPNDTKHQGEWYDISYKKETIQQYDGGSGDYVDVDALFIVSIQEANGGSSNSTGSNLSLDFLNNYSFFNDADGWVLEFTDDNIIFYPGIDQGSYDVYYYPDKNSCFTSISSDELLIKATPNMDKGYIWAITIKKQPCSSGTYNYSIHMQWEDGTVDGCGKEK
ncbi:MAG: hypothetical protein JXR68_09685 [Bacteroidales bacterium]|nr:hypothetical protein [Bacteroidales bacterium]